MMLALVITLTISAKAQDPQNVIKVNPLGALFGAANLGYERVLGEKTSIEITPSFGTLNFGGLKYSSVGLGADYRFYHSKEKNAPLGFYIAPGLQYSGGKISATDDFGNSADVKFSSFSVKGVLGRQWIWDSGFTIDLNGGVSYSTFNYSGGSNLQGLTFKGSGIIPTLSFALGYAF